MINPWIAIVFIAVVAGVFILSRILKNKRAEKKQDTTAQIEQPIAASGSIVAPAAVTKAVEPSTQKQPATDNGIHPDDNGTYRCIVFKDKPAAGEPDAYFSRINKPAGTLWYADPSLPENGMSYVIRETDEGSYEPYDPREQPFEAKKTPQMAYFATHWDIVAEVYIWSSNSWEKFNSALAWATLGVMLLLGMIAIDKL